MIDYKARNARIVAAAKAHAKLAKTDPEEALEQFIEWGMLNPDGSVPEIYGGNGADGKPAKKTMSYTQFTS